MSDQPQTPPTPTIARQARHITAAVPPPLIRRPVDHQRLTDLWLRVASSPNRTVNGFVSPTKCYRGKETLGGHVYTVWKLRHN